MAKSKEKKSILLIDDDPDMLDIGRIIIRKAGYDFMEATTPQEGLRKIRKNRPNLVLLDYMMPDMKGDEFFHKLVTEQQYKAVRDTPVIMLTARGDNGIDRASLFRRGLAAFLIKPFGHRELINVIENVLQVNEIRRENIRLHEEVRRTEYKYRDLIENANDVIFTLNEEGLLVFVNSRLKSITGYEENEWLNRPIFDLVVPDDHDLVFHAFRNCLHGKCSPVEFRVPHKSGEIRHFSTTLNPIGEAENIEGVVGIARDITERKKLENRIVELKNFSDSIIKSIGSGLITVDMKNRVTYFNNAAARILKIPPEKAIGQKISKFLKKEEIDRLFPESPKEEPADLNREMEITDATGEKVFIGFTTTPWVDNNQNKMGTIISFRDISEIKRLQVEMIRMDRLASLGVLASGIAHEIRNPLAGIKTMAQTLEEEMEPGDSRQEYLSRIIRQVNRLDELLKAFFSYARPRPPIKKWHDLPDIVHEVTMLLNKRISSTNVVLEEKYAKNLPQIFVDLNQIQQIFINLILNALDAMPKGGTLTLTAEPVRTALKAVDRRRKNFRRKLQETLYVKVSVQDTGSGIPAEHLDAIFDPFFTTKSQGTGLGLSIVYRILEEHGGEIQVSSKVGKGTTFTLLLPAEE